MEKTASYRYFKEGADAKNKNYVEENGENVRGTSKPIWRPISFYSAANISEDIKIILAEIYCEYKD
jgi:hypothetical protein